jgi:hypothetical protein
MMQTLSNAIEPASEIQINRLRWVLTNETDPKDDDKTKSVTPVPEQAVAAHTQSNFAPDPRLLYEVGFISGEIKNFTGDYHKALESVNRLSNRLKADSAVAQVIILQNPVNVSSYSSLQGSTADERAAQLPAALFKLRVILKSEEVPPV